MQNSNIRAYKLLRRSYRRELQSTAYVIRRTSHASNINELSSEITSAKIMHRISHVELNSCIWRRQHTTFDLIKYDSFIAIDFNNLIWANL